MINLDNSLNMGRPLFESTRALVMGLISNFPLGNNFQIRLLLSDGGKMTSYDLKSKTDIGKILLQLQNLNYNDKPGLEIGDFIAKLSAKLKFGNPKIPSLMLLFNPFSIPDGQVRFPNLDANFRPKFFNFNLRTKMPDFRYVFEVLLPKCEYVRSYIVVFLLTRPLFKVLQTRIFLLLKHIVPVRYIMEY